MSNIAINELSQNKELTNQEMAEVRGGISFHLQQQLNQFQANLNARGAILFNPHYQYQQIRMAQMAWRGLYGRQMPWRPYRLV